MQPKKRGMLHCEYNNRKKKVEFLRIFSSVMSNLNGMKFNVEVPFIHNIISMKIPLTIPEI